MRFDIQAVSLCCIVTSDLKTSPGARVRHIAVTYLFSEIIRKKLYSACIKISCILESSIFIKGHYNLKILLFGHLFDLCFLKHVCTLKFKYA